MRVAFPLGGTDFGKSGIGTYVRSILPHMASGLRDDGGSLLALGNRAELDAYADQLSGIEQACIPSAFERPGRPTVR